ncbi:MAG: dihydrodipicolinate synthase family protein [Treponema sp.]
MRESLKKYHGIFPAFYACYDDNGNISPDRVEQFTSYLIKKGVNGLYVGGSSGECIYQTIEERKLVLDHVMAVAKGKIPVIAHIAAPSTRHSIELAEHAEKAGADAIAAIPPIYFVLPEDAIFRYWSDMAAAVNLDFIIYNIPGTTHYNLSMSLFNRMRENKKVIGVKNSSMPVQDIQKFKAAAGEDFIIFNGPDEQFIAGRVMGASAGIGGTYAAMPELFLAADACVETGNMKRGLEIQNAINDIIYTVLGCRGNLYSVFKEVLKRKGMNIGGARLPLAPVAAEDESLIRSVIEKIDRAVETFSK